MFFFGMMAGEDWANSRSVIVIVEDDSTIFLNRCQNVISEGVIFGQLKSARPVQVFVVKSIGHKQHRIKATV